MHRVKGVVEIRYLRRSSMQSGAVGTIQQTVQVTYDFPVHFTDSAFSLNNATIRELCQPSAGRDSAKVLVVLDGGLAQALSDIAGDIVWYFDSGSDAASLVEPPLQVDGGESVKNDLSSVTSILETIERHGIDSHSYVIAIGGGALLDMVCFAASIAH